MKKIFNTLLHSLFILSLVVSCHSEVAEDIVCQCITEEAMDITITTATIRGKVTGLPKDQSFSYAYFYFSEEVSSIDSLVNKGDWLLVSGNDLEFGYTLHNLTPNHKYYYVAAVTVNGEDFYGEVFSFTTLDLLVETEDAQNLTVFSVDLSGKVEELPPLVQDIKYGFEVGDDENYLYFLEGKIEDNGVFTLSVIHLPNVQGYYYRACVQYNGNSYYGDIKYVQVPSFNVEIETRDATLVQHTTAVLHGYLPTGMLNDCSLFFYYTGWEGDISDGRIVSGSRSLAGISSGSILNGNCSFYSNIGESWGDLEPGKTYYYQAVIGYQNRFSFGEIRSFTTKDYSFTNGVAVDLGLSVKWCSTNLGALSPEDNGMPVAWGEVDTKKSFEESNYTLCGGSLYSLNKYCSNTEYGVADDKTDLELADDAAYVKMGADWRMPTWVEFMELCNGCKWEYGEMNGIEGWIGRSKVNKNSIFIPNTGFILGRTTLSANGSGCYWTASMPYGGDCRYASTIWFDSRHTNTNPGELSGARRDHGYFVRPVRNNP